MNKLKLLFTALIIGFSAQINAQTADEILATYFENIGGLENLEKIEGIKITASAKGQGMEIPVEIVQLKGGKQYVKISLQGKEVTQLAFDGETMWTTNFRTMKAEKSDA